MEDLIIEAWKSDPVFAKKPLPHISYRYMNLLLLGWDPWDICEIMYEETYDA